MTYVIDFSDKKISKVFITEDYQNYPLVFDATTLTVDSKVFNELTTKELPKARKVKKIKEAFVGGTGRHPQFVYALKKQLKDPDSFEHLQTTYVIDESGDTVTITMAFKAKNSFGGYEKRLATGIADSDGNILSCEIQE